MKEQSTPVFRLEEIVWNGFAEALDKIKDDKNCPSYVHQVLSSVCNKIPKIIFCWTKKVGKQEEERKLPKKAGKERGGEQTTQLLKESRKKEKNEPNKEKQEKVI